MVKSPFTCLSHSAVVYVLLHVFLNFQNKNCGSKINERLSVVVAIISIPGGSDDGIGDGGGVSNVGVIGDVGGRYLNVIGPDKAPSHWLGFFESPHLVKTIPRGSVA